MSRHEEEERAVRDMHAIHARIVAEIVAREGRQPTTLEDIAATFEAGNEWMRKPRSRPSRWRHRAYMAAALFLVVLDAIALILLALR